MAFAWADDEGYEIYFSRIIERYGKDITPSIDSITSELNLLEETSRDIERKAEEARRKIPMMVESINQRASDLNKLRQDLEVQERHLQIDRKETYAEKIRHLKQTIGITESYIASDTAALEQLKVEAVRCFEQEADVERLVKLRSYLIAEDNRPIYDPYIQPRNRPESFDLNIDTYQKVMDNFAAGANDTVWYKPNDLVYAETDDINLHVSWNEIVNKAVDIFWRLRDARRQVHSMNGRLFLEWNQNFRCLISASRINGVKDSGEYRLAIAGRSVDTSHPLYPEVKLRLPPPFLIFNEAISVRHDFLPATFAQDAWWARKKPEDYDDED